jgi:hypothetical protein
MINYYAGVGSRNTPPHILVLMQLIAFRLAEMGWVLRSGAAPGADQAFQRGVEEWIAKRANVNLFDYCQIYIPWHTFGKMDLTHRPEVHVLGDYDYTRANSIAAEIHPAWDNCSIAAKSLHSRNVFQVLGTTFDQPVKMCICWAEPTRDGNVKGGTRTAWVLAKQHGAKCINLAETAAYQKALEFVEVSEERLLTLAT